MKISYFIFLSFLFILLLFSFTTYINFQQSKEVKANAEYVSTSGDIQKFTNRFQRNTLHMVNALRGFLLSGDRGDIDAFDSAYYDNETVIGSLSPLIAGDTSQNRRLSEIKIMYDQWTDDFAFPLKDAKLNSIISDSALIHFNRMYRETSIAGSEKELQRRLQTKFRDFSNYEYERRYLRSKELAESVKSTRQISFYLTILSLVLGVFIVSYLTYRISTRINKMVTLADSIASGNYKVHIEEAGEDELGKLSKSLNHMANELSENITQLKRKNEELDQFAHIVSHDLKSPLRGIGNVINWIEEDHGAEVTPKVNEYLQLIKGRVIRAENLIQGILSYARIGKEELENEVVDTKELLNEVIESVNQKQGIKIDISAVLPVMYTKRIPLFQVFSNLVGNAVKYHDKQLGEVRIYHHEHPSHYEFFIQDDGPGISNKYHQKIFMIFQTLKERDNFESTGVGLAIVKKILQARGETIQLSSEEGKGATFSFTWSKNN
ncbi:MAG: HAMP domain-containing protein [Sphingobacteriales bacterium]|nr:MAG: HAMP domain-containing protein [Sphingobacteriales bacterium]